MPMQRRVPPTPWLRAYVTRATWGGPVFVGDWSDRDAVVHWAHAVDRDTWETLRAAWRVRQHYARQHTEDLLADMRDVAEFELLVKLPPDWTALVRRTPSELRPGLLGMAERMRSENDGELPDIVTAVATAAAEYAGARA